MNMIPFEVHITGEEKIIQELKILGYKSIVVKLLKPDLTLLRTEYMSSFIVKDTYPNIFSNVLNLVNKLTCEIHRVKIECPPLRPLFPMSVYVESHFAPHIEGRAFVPVSENAKTNKLMGTDREYNKPQYEKFLEIWKNEDCELCIFDSNMNEDSDWFRLYE